MASESPPLSRVGREVDMKVCALLIACAAFLGRPDASGAQALSSFRFQLDNDYFDFWLEAHHRPDDNYTGGESFRAVFNAVPRWAQGRKASCDSAQRAPGNTDRCVQSFISAAQQIFTPTNDSPRPVVGERPYAGLLYADFGRLEVDARQLRSLAVRLGTTGYYSGAEAAQKAFHRVSTQRRPQGWDYQVAGEPVIGLTYARQYLLTPDRVIHNPPFQMIAGGGAVATHLQSGIHGGLELRAGFRLPHPWIPASGIGRRGLHAYLIIGGSEEWVVRNLLIEGNSAATRDLVNKRPFVFQSVWGVAIGTGGYYIEYRAVGHSDEYSPSPGWHRWGTLSFIRGIP